MSKWLDHSTLDQRLPGSKPLSDLPKCDKRNNQLSVIPGKEEKGITRSGHIERKDQGRTAPIICLFS